MRPEKTWVLITDGARGRLVAAVGHGAALQITEEREFHADHSPNRDLDRDRPVRVFESYGSGRHSIEPKTDRHRELKRSFAHEIADALDDNLSQKKFERLVIAAPPVTLGDLRKVMSEAVKSKIIAEVAMDLTKVPNSEVPRHIMDLIPN